MELIYFILGFLFTVTGYGIVLLYKTKSSHATLLGEITQYRDLTSTYNKQLVTESNLIRSDMEEISGYYNSIQRLLKDDKYDGINKINERITAVTELFNEQGNRNKRLFDMADQQLRQNQKEIQQANNTLKKIIDDPTTLARY
tara:strand:- start:603 stop:1031 length:429 start_codon:yes stop_codon:yes gene_type:complete